jgi:N-acetylneuraminate synthase
MRQIEIGGRKVGQDSPPFIVAEMSGNHNQSLDRALEIVDAAAAAGAHGLKIQTYTADTITIRSDNPDFHIGDKSNLWSGNTLHSLYEKAHTPWDWHKPILQRCREHGLIGFSTPFDHSAVDFLEELDVPCYKIASFEIVDLPLIRKVASTGKPVIMSTGMATVAELDDAVRAAREAGCEQIVLLKCTSSYPASPEDANIRTVAHLKDLFDVQVGLSDHTLGVGVAVAGVAMGASLIEKHFTLKRADGGVDAAFSLEPAEVTTLVEETERAWQALGSVRYGPSGEKEKRSLIFRRSLYVTEDVSAGEPLTSKNLRSIRPGYGLPPKHYESLLGKRLKCDVRRGTAMTWDLLE